MVIETLQTTLRAALQAVEVSCGWRLHVERIYQSPEQTFPFEHVAAAHYPDGSLRRLLVGCDKELALHAWRRNAAVTEDRNEVDAPEQEGEGGFRQICKAVQDALHEQMGWTGPERKLLPQDASQYRACALRARNFYAYIPTPAGDLHLVMDLSARKGAATESMVGTDNYKARPRGEVVEPANDGVASPEQVREILAEIRKREETVMIRLVSDDKTAHIHHATVLDIPAEGKGERLTLTSPCLLGSEFAFAKGRELTVIIQNQDQVLQFKSPVVALSHAAVDHEVYIPSMAVAIPEKLEAGQRREAFRVVPSARIMGQFRTLALTGRRRRSHTQRFMVLDLSKTGSRIAITEDTLFSYVRWGRQVICVFELPPRYGTVEVLGTVRRVLLYPDSKSKRKAHLGIEFDREDERSRDGLNTIRQYVADCQCKVLEGRSDFVVNPS